MWTCGASFDYKLEVPGGTACLLQKSSPFPPALHSLIDELFLWKNIQYLLTKLNQKVQLDEKIKQIKIDNKERGIQNTYITNRNI